MRKQTHPGASAVPDRTLHDLVELVEALDRRVPQDRPGEPRIALEAAHLRQQARARIQELESSAPERGDTDTANAVMSDDGAP